MKQLLSDLSGVRRRGPSAGVGMTTAIVSVGAYLGTGDDTLNLTLNGTLNAAARVALALIGGDGTDSATLTESDQSFLVQSTIASDVETVTGF